MANEKKLYKKPTITSDRNIQPVMISKSYRGMSTISDEAAGVKLYDLALIKQDLVNHFHIVRN